MTEITPIGNLAELGQFGVAQTLEEQYLTLRAKCIEQYGPDFCNSVMPRTMMYALTRPGEGYRLPWWMWMIAGLLVGKVLK